MNFGVFLASAENTNFFAHHLRLVNGYWSFRILEENCKTLVINITNWRFGKAKFCFMMQKSIKKSSISDHEIKCSFSKVQFLRIIKKFRVNFLVQIKNSLYKWAFGFNLSGKICRKVQLWREILACYRSFASSFLMILKNCTLEKENFILWSEIEDFFIIKQNFPFPKRQFEKFLGKCYSKFL